MPRRFSLVLLTALLAGSVVLIPAQVRAVLAAASPAGTARMRLPAVGTASANVRWTVMGHSGAPVRVPILLYT